MTNEEAIKHLEFMAKGYQNLLDNDERCLEAVGKGYKGEVESQEWGKMQKKYTNKILYGEEDKT